MRIEELTLKHFRNYDSLQLQLNNSNHIALLGLNAQGKSNFLESIYTLAFASSFRSHSPTELIQWQASYSRLQTICRYERGDEFLLLFEVRQDGKRKIQVNYTYQKRLQDYIGYLKLVLFSQQDLNLIIGQPARRRLLIDLLMVQIRPGYYELLTNYHRILKQRNSLLKEIKSDFKVKDSEKIEQLDLWDIQLAGIAERIINQRKHILNELMQIVKQTHIAISGLHEELQVEYKTISDSSANYIYSSLCQKRQKDIMLGQTTTGPHRDDLVFKMNQRDLKQIGSQGQIRTAALAVKVAELLFTFKHIGEYPILLLDDVFSELDTRRQQLLIEQIHLPGLQTFMTTTHLEGTVKKLFEENSLILNVHKGQIVKA